MIIAKYTLLISTLTELDLMGTTEDKTLGLIVLIGGACLILFRKKKIRDIMKPADSWIKEPLSQREAKLGLKRTDTVRICERLNEVVFIIFGILMIAWGLPSFLPNLHRPVVIISISFFFIFLPAVFGTSAITLLLFPLWGWKLRRYRKNKSVIPQPTSLSQPPQDNADTVLRELKKEATQYGIICSIIAFVICLLVAIKIALFFDIFNL